VYSIQIARKPAPGLLDGLSADDPRALRARRQLRRLNTLMLNGRLVARELKRAFELQKPRLIVQLGAGDGRFMLQIAHKLPKWRPLDVILLDRQPLVSAETVADFRAVGWRAQAVKADARTWLSQPMRFAPDVIVTNMFLHRFDTAGLFELMSHISQRSQVLIACEPRRTVMALAGSRLLRMAGCNDIARHDAAASVRAGFDEQELTASWPQGAGWILREEPYGFFSHCFVAKREASGARADAPATAR
jgi:hypothetical protein